MAGNTLISVKDFISLNTESKPKRGDWVMVGDSEPPKHKRIFLTEIEGVERPYFCVHDADETNFQKGENVRTVSWPFMAPIVEPTIPTDDPDSLIGRKVMGWRFDPHTPPHYEKKMDAYVGKIGIIDRYISHNDYYFVLFGEVEWAYPASEIHAHLIPEPNNYRRALLENPELPKFINEVHAHWVLGLRTGGFEQTVSDFIASELSTMDPKI